MKNTLHKLFVGGVASGSFLLLVIQHIAPVYLVLALITGELYAALWPNWAMIMLAAVVAFYALRVGRAAIAGYFHFTSDAGRRELDERHVDELRDHITAIPVEISPELLSAFRDAARQGKIARLLQALQLNMLACDPKSEIDANSFAMWLGGELELACDSLERALYVAHKLEMTTYAAYMSNQLELTDKGRALVAELAVLGFYSNNDKGVQS